MAICLLAGKVFSSSAMNPVWRHFNQTLIARAMKKYTKSLKATRRERGISWKTLREGSHICLFTGSLEWQACSLDGSGVSREAHAPFCEGPGVKFPPFTHRLAINYT
ncbi:MAG: hypothetical protein AB1611_18600 [bacterium]